MQIVAAKRDIEPGRARVRHTPQLDLRADTAAQGGLDFLAKGKTRRILARNHIDRGQPQAMLPRQFLFERDTGLRRQFNPGLGRQDDQSGQVVG